MTPARKKTWSEQTMRLTRATLTTFTGPGCDLTVVLHGKRDGAPKVTLQREANRGARSTKGRA